MYDISPVIHSAKPTNGALFMWARLRVQIGGACLFQIIPYCARVIFNGNFTWPLYGFPALIAGLTCTVAAGIFFRNLSRYPGIQVSSYVLPCVALPFGMMVIFLTIVKPDFSRSIFITSLCINVLWYYAVFFMLQRQRDLRIGLVPLGAVQPPRGVRGVSFVKLEQPLAIRDLDGIAADLSGQLPGQWESALAEYALSGTPVYDLRQLSESLTGRVRIDHISHNNFGALAPLTSYLRLRRVFDAMTALIALVVLSPVLFAVAIAIRWETPGPALFRQKRIGYRGRAFTVLKFRSMRCEEVPVPDRRLQAVTRPSDQRITRFGRFLRRSRIDELPQMINIIRGEMSWIGPRPEADVLSAWYEEEIPFYRYRHIVPPGITGWAQVNQGHVTNVDEVRTKLQYDFYYVKHFSLWLDIHIAMRTVRTMITGMGSR